MGGGFLTRRSRLRLLAAATACVAALRIGGVSAHTELVFSDPADSAGVATAPQHIDLHFTRRVSPVLTVVTLSNSAGHPVGGLHQTADPGDPTVLVVTLPPLPNDAYRLTYTVLDQVDFHRTEGSVVFGVGERSTLAPQQATAYGPGILDSTLRFVDRSALSLLLGVLALVLLVVPRARRVEPGVARLHRPLLRIGLGALAAMAVAETATLFSNASGLPAGTGFGEIVTSTDFGRIWCLSAGLLLLLAAALTVMVLIGDAATSRGAWARRIATVSAAGLAIADAFAAAAGGHNGDAAGDTVGGVLVRGSHLLTVGAWSGGLVALVVALVLIRGAAHRGARRAALRAVSPVAAFAFLGACASGLVLAGVQVETVTALFSTQYGTLLIAKVVAVLLVGALGLYHAVAIRGGVSLFGRLSWRPRPARSRTLVLEAAGGLAIIGVAVVLGGTQPARGPAFDPPVTPSAYATSATDGDLLIRVSLRPNLPGRNLLEVSAFSERRPARAPVGPIRVTLSGPATTTRVLDLPTTTIAGATSGGPRGVGSVPVGSSTAVNSGATASEAVVLDAPGALTLDLSIARPGIVATTAVMHWTVDPPAVPRHPAVVSTASLSPFTTILAGLILGGVAVYVGARIALGSRPSRTPADIAGPPAPPQGPRSGGDVDTRPAGTASHNAGPGAAGGSPAAPGDAEPVLSEEVELCLR